jgi:hypothetical protein
MSLADGCIYLPCSEGDVRIRVGTDAVAFLSECEPGDVVPDNLLWMAQP